MFAVTCAGELEFIYRYTWEHGPAVVDHLLGLDVRRPFKHSTWPNKLISRRKTTRIDCVSLPVEVPLDVPDLVHLVAQQGSELDPKCDT